MGAETWRLHTVHDAIINDQTILRSPKEELSAEERDELHDEVLACVRQFGFQLQQWADRWYLTRNQDWNLVVRPWCAQKYRPFSTDSLSGADEQAFIALDEKLAVAFVPISVSVRQQSYPFHLVFRFMSSPLCRDKDIMSAPNSCFFAW